MREGLAGMGLGGREARETTAPPPKPAALPWDGVGLEWAAFPMGDGVVDLFIARIRDPWGLPPMLHGLRLRALFRRVAARRPTAALWVAVEVPGTWFRREVADGLLGLPAPVAVTGGAPPALRDFTFPPRTFPRLSPPPSSSVPPFPSDLELRLLTALLRMREAFTAEIAAQAGLSPSTARRILRGMARPGAGWVEETSARYPRWRLTRKGLSMVRRALGLPPGARFFDGREKGGGSRHQRTARLWPAWVRKALRATIWGGWTETVLSATLRPDAVAWGEWRGRETLFLLEVESGHRSRTDLRFRLRRRLQEAAPMLRGYPVVLATLGPPWVIRALAMDPPEIPPGVAVVLGDWKAFGRLPEPVFGAVRT